MTQLRTPTFLERLASSEGWSQTPAMDKIAWLADLENTMETKAEEKYEGGWAKWQEDNKGEIDKIHNLRVGASQEAQNNIESTRLQWKQNWWNSIWGIGEPEKTPIEAVTEFAVGGTMRSILAPMFDFVGADALAHDYRKYSDRAGVGLQIMSDKLWEAASEADDDLKVTNELLAFAQEAIPFTKGFLRDPNKKLFREIAEQEGMIDENGNIDRNALESTNMFRWMGHVTKIGILLGAMPGFDTLSKSGVAGHALAYALSSGIINATETPIEQQSVPDHLKHMTAVFGAMALGGGMARMFSKSPLKWSLVSKLPKAMVPMAAQFTVERVADVGESIGNAVELYLSQDVKDPWLILRTFPAALAANILQEIVADIPSYFTGGRISGAGLFLNRKGKGVKKARMRLEEMTALEGSLRKAIVASKNKNGKKKLQGVLDVLKKKKQGRINQLRQFVKADFKSKNPYLAGKKDEILANAQAKEAQGLSADEALDEAIGLHILSDETQKLTGDLSARDFFDEAMVIETRGNVEETLAKAVGKAEAAGYGLSLREESNFANESKQIVGEYAAEISRKDEEAKVLAQEQRESELKEQFEPTALDVLSGRITVKEADQILSQVDEADRPAVERLLRGSLREVADQTGIGTVFSRSIPDKAREALSEGREEFNESEFAKVAEVTGVLPEGFSNLGQPTFKEVQRISNDVEASLPMPTYSLETGEEITEGNLDSGFIKAVKKRIKANDGRSLSEHPVAIAYLELNKILDRLIGEGPVPTSKQDLSETTHQVAEIIRKSDGISDEVKKFMSEMTPEAMEAFRNAHPEQVEKPTEEDEGEPELEEESAQAELEKSPVDSVDEAVRKINDNVDTEITPKVEKKTKAKPKAKPKAKKVNALPNYDEEFEEEVMEERPALKEFGKSGSGIASFKDFTRANYNANKEKFRFFDTTKELEKYRKKNKGKKGDYLVSLGRKKKNDKSGKVYKFTTKWTHIKQAWALSMEKGNYHFYDTRLTPRSMIRKGVDFSIKYARSKGLNYSLNFETEQPEFQLPTPKMKGTTQAKGASVDILGSDLLGEQVDKNGKAKRRSEESRQRSWGRENFTLTVRSVQPVSSDVKKIIEFVRAAEDEMKRNNPKAGNSRKFEDKAKWDKALKDGRAVQGVAKHTDSGEDMIVLAVKSSKNQNPSSVHWQSLYNLSMLQWMDRRRDLMAERQEETGDELITISIANTEYDDDTIYAYLSQLADYEGLSKSALTKAGTRFVKHSMRRFVGKITTDMAGETDIDKVLAFLNEKMGLSAKLEDRQRHYGTGKTRVEPNNKKGNRLLIDVQAVKDQAKPFVLRHEMEHALDFASGMHPNSKRPSSYKNFHFSKSENKQRDTYLKRMHELSVLQALLTGDDEISPENKDLYFYLGEYAPKRKGELGAEFSDAPSSRGRWTFIPRVKTFGTTPTTYYATVSLYDKGKIRFGIGVKDNPSSASMSRFDTKQEALDAANKLGRKEVANRERGEISSDFADAFGPSKKPKKAKKKAKRQTKAEKEAEKQREKRAKLKLGVKPELQVTRVKSIEEGAEFNEWIIKVRQNVSPKGKPIFRKTKYKVREDKDGDFFWAYVGKSYNLERIDANSMKAVQAQISQTLVRSKKLALAPRELKSTPERNLGHTKEIDTPESRAIEQSLADGQEEIDEEKLPMAMIVRSTMKKKFKFTSKTKKLPKQEYGTNNFELIPEHQFESVSAFNVVAILNKMFRNHRRSRQQARMRALVIDGSLGRVQLVVGPLKGDVSHKLAIQEIRFRDDISEVEARDFWRQHRSSLTSAVSSQQNVDFHQNATVQQDFIKAADIDPWVAKFMNKNELIQMELSDERMHDAHDRSDQEMIDYIRKINKDVPSSDKAPATSQTAQEAIDRINQQVEADLFSSEMQDDQVFTHEEVQSMKDVAANRAIAEEASSEEERGPLVDKTIDVAKAEDDLKASGIETTGHNEYTEEEDDQIQGSIYLGGKRSRFSVEVSRHGMFHLLENVIVTSDLEGAEEQTELVDSFESIEELVQRLEPQTQTAREHIKELSKKTKLPTTRFEVTKEIARLAARHNETIFKIGEQGKFNSKGELVSAPKGLKGEATKRRKALSNEWSLEYGDSEESAQAYIDFVQASLLDRPTKPVKQKISPAKQIVHQAKPSKATTSGYIHPDGMFQEKSIVEGPNDLYTDMMKWEGSLKSRKKMVDDHKKGVETWRRKFYKTGGVRKTYSRGASGLTYNTGSIGDLQKALIKNDLNAFPVEYENVPVTITDLSTGDVFSFLMDDFHKTGSLEGLLGNSDVSSSFSDTPHESVWDFEEGNDREAEAASYTSANVLKESPTMIGKVGEWFKTRKWLGGKNQSNWFSEVFGSPELSETTFVKEILGIQHKLSRGELVMAETLFKSMKNLFSLRTNFKKRALELLAKGELANKVFTSEELKKENPYVATAYLDVRRSLDSVLEHEKAWANELIVKIENKIDDLDPSKSKSTLVAALKSVKASLKRLERLKGKGYLPHRWKSGKVAIRFEVDAKALKLKADSPRVEKLLTIIRNDRAAFNPFPWAAQHKIAEGGKFDYRMHFNGVSEAENVQKQLADIGIDARTEAVDKFDPFEIVSGVQIVKVLGSVRDELSKGKLGNKAEAREAMKLLVDAIITAEKAKGMNKHFLHREGVWGYKTGDIEGVLMDYMKGYSRMYSKRAMASDMYDVFDRIPKRSKRDRRVAFRLIDSILAPKLTAWERNQSIFTSFLFYRYLPFNVPFHVRNRLQPWYFGMPVLAKNLKEHLKLGQLASFGTASKNIASAQVSVRLMEVWLMRNDITMDNREKLLAQVKGMRDTEAEQLRWALEHQLLAESLPQEWSERLDTVFKKPNMKGTGAYLNLSKRWVMASDAKNRVQMFIAGIRSGLDQQQALQMSREANVVYANYNVPGLLQTKMGRNFKFLFPFQRYLWHTTEWQVRSLGKKATIPPILAYWLMSALISGKDALPLFDDTFLAKITPAEWEVKARKEVVKLVGGNKAALKLLDHGAFGLAGVDMSNYFKVHPFKVVDPFVGESAALGVFADIDRAIDSVKRGRYQKGIVEDLPLFPRWMAKLSKAQRQATEGVTTYHGDIQLDVRGKKIKLSKGEIAQIAMGFMPSRLGLQYKGRKLLRKLTDYYSVEKSRIGTKYKVAYHSKNRSELRDAKKMIKDFNKQLRKFRVKGKTPVPEITDNTVRNWKRGANSERIRLLQGELLY